MSYSQPRTFRRISLTPLGVADFISDGMESKDKAFIKTVVAHYKKHGRHDLPWRRAITPYKILISEIMLQQTQVARVLPKYEAWMKKFPTLKSLQTGSFLEILYLWQGLGYQRRAKALFDVAQGNPKLPTEYEKLLRIPGIGPYTASAILAFAYDAFPPRLLETNIRTALIEEFHFHKTDIDDNVLAEDLARLQSHKEVKKLGARAWYYALMDYGAYLKTQKISHNKKSKHYAKQTPYKGSVRELRAKVLFAVTHKNKLPDDNRTKNVLQKLIGEGYIKKSGRGYAIV